MSRLANLEERAGVLAKPEKAASSLMQDYEMTPLNLTLSQGRDLVKGLCSLCSLVFQISGLVVHMPRKFRFTAGSFTSSRQGPGACALAGPDPKTPNPTF